MKTLNLTILLLISLFFSTCKDERKVQLTLLVNEWQGKVPFLFFFHPKDTKEIRYLLKRDGFDRPVCIDMDDRLNKANLFPKDITFQTFLLDKDNKVAVLGNPVYNLAIKNLYLKQITGKDSPTKNMPKTTAEIAHTEIDFGTFDKSEVKETTIELKNTGDNPLVIVDVSTTCGCTAATYDKRPAKVAVQDVHIS